jgi:hypothetical protein
MTESAAVENLATRQYAEIASAGIAAIRPQEAPSLSK